MRGDSSCSCECWAREKGETKINGVVLQEGKHGKVPMPVGGINI